MENKLDEYVNVSLRIRPVLSQDSTTSSCLHVISKEPPVIFVQDRPQSYHFDNIFTEEVNQAIVYNETVKPLVEYVKQGYNCTVFAYGQTGTGKTYTMGTSTQIASEEDDGLIPRALDQFFAFGDDNTEVDISVSFIEIYNEKAFDLLQNDHNPPLIVKGFKAQGFSQEKVYSYQDAKHLLERGNKNRHTAGTKQNSNSSRSHAIFTIYLNVRYKDYEMTAKLNLVDLAGCESVKKTGNQGSTFQEGININKGLLCIGQVMTALSTNSNYIPYRQSIITTILQDSLNKKNFVSLIACINSNPEDCNETIQTLEFAHRVKKMKNKPEVNEILMHYKKENPALFQCMKISNTPFKRPTGPYQTPCPSKRVKNLLLRSKEPSLSGNSTTADSPKSLFMSVSSISSQVDITQQTLSPVIKKYMNAMESSLMDRLEMVIKNTLKRPTRSSLLMKETKLEDKENTPSMSWNKIQNEVSKLVRNEIAQLTGVPARAASSPIDDRHDFVKIKKVLNYDCLALNEKLEESENCVNSTIDHLNLISAFKVPELPITKEKKLKRTPSISPIEYILTKPRRSVRLSKKRIENSNSFKESDVTLESSCIQIKNKSERYSDNPNNKTEHHDEFQYDRRRLYDKSIVVEDGSFQFSTVGFRHTNNQSVKVDDNMIKKFVDSQCDTRRSIRLAKKKVHPQQAESSRKNNDISDGDSVEKYNLTEINAAVINDEGFEEKCSPKKKSYGSTFDGNKSIMKSNFTYENIEHGCKRQSIRLRHKNKTLQRNRISESPPSRNGRRKSTVVVKKRRTILCVKDTPIGKRLLKNNAVMDSPATSHTKHVLNMLNDGNLKQLEKLHSIGPKTAQQVLLFREINGPLTKISDLSRIPGWHGKKFTKFSEANFLKKELI